MRGDSFFISSLLVISFAYIPLSSYMLDYESNTFYSRDFRIRSSIGSLCILYTIDNTDYYRTRDNRDNENILYS